MLESCMRPDLVVEITMQPVRRYGVDAAILFSDIVLPLKAIGVDVDIKPGVGPVMGAPLQSRHDLDQLRPLEPADVDFITTAVSALLSELGETPLIGFAGAPFTVASYLVEGGPSRNHERTRALMHADPDLWHELMGRLVGITSAFLAVQVDAGASAIQLFDSWAGVLSERDYREFVLPHSHAVLESVAGRVPRIHFGVGTAELLPAMASAGPEVLGVDWRLPLSEASRRVGPDYAVQGNLDPAFLQAPWPVLEAEVRRVLADGAGTPGHVFNLGHGVPKEADPDVLARVVEVVQTWDGRQT